MKLGILTYHRAINFGSALQAYALNRYLRDMGLDAQVIDYHTHGQDALYTLFEKPHSVLGAARNAQSLFRLKALKKQKERFDTFLSENVSLSEKEYTDDSDLSELNGLYDGFLCGSDQIWNPNCGDFSNAYLLDFAADKSRCWSYAPSLGVSDPDDRTKALLRQYVQNYCGLSVREQQGADLLAVLTGRPVACVPDPVFLLDPEQWRDLIPSRPVREKYIFCYFIGDIPDMRRFAVQMRRRTGYRLVVVYQNLRDELYRCKKMYDAGPEQWLSLLYHSEFVITNSFHAVSFSLIFQKDFWVFETLDRGNASSRIDSLLGKTGLTDRILNPSTGLPADPLSHIAYSELADSLQSIRETGRQYLQKHFSKRPDTGSSQ